MKYKIIYANGDSYAAGDELAYSKYYPDFASLYTKEEPRPPPDKMIRRWRKAMEQDWDKFRLYQKECLTLTYSAKVAENLGLHYINQSLGGRSNQEMISLTIEYLERRLLRIYKPEEILILIGVTGFTRFQIPLEDRLCGSTSLLLGYPLDGQEGIYTHYTHNMNDAFMLRDNAMHFLAATSYFEKKGIDVLYVDNIMYDSSRGYHMHSIEHDSMISLLPDPDVIMASYMYPRERLMHICGHFSEEVHKRTADNIVEIIKEKYPTKV